MKNGLSLVLLFLVTLITGVNIYAQEFTLTTTSTNVISSMARIDMPGLTLKPNAIIVATVVGNPAILNPHPIGAWYYSDKWYIFNTDQKVMPNGLTFKLQVALIPDANHFLHIIPQAEEGQTYSIIDKSVLNNNPSAPIKILQNHAPGTRPDNINPYEAEARYNSTIGKWCIVNVGGNTLKKDTAYNIVIGSEVTGTNPVPTPTPGPASTPNPTSMSPASTTPTGSAGGDLSGTYPDPTVQKLNGNPLSNVAPKVGEILRWNGTEWEPAVAMQTYFKKNTSGSIELNDTNSLSVVTGLSHTIVLAKKSRLIVSVQLGTSGPNSPLGITSAEGKLSFRVNNQQDEWGSRMSFVVEQMRHPSVGFSNYMIDLEPGTYFIEFLVAHESGTANFSAYGQYSSIVVLPL